MTDQHAEQIIAELRAIRALLANKPAAPAAASAPASAGAPKDIPQPSELVADPGSVEVHFGKNAGKPLRSLGAKSVEWYAQEPEPRIGNNGKPFPPRPADEQLANAARQLYHAKRGTLVGKAPVAEMNFTPGSAAPDIDENVPF